MPLSAQELAHLCHLCRLQISADEEAIFRARLSRVIDHMHALEQVDTQSTSSTCHTLQQPLPLQEDVVAPSICRQKFLASVPDHVSGLVRVPPIHPS